MDSTKTPKTKIELDKQIMTDNTWAHVRCEELIQETKYGNVTITFRINNGRIHDLLCQSFRRYRNEDTTVT